MQGGIETIFGVVPQELENEWDWVVDHFSPLQALYQSEGVTEIFVNRFDSISIEKDGQIQKTDIQFPNEAAFNDLIEQLATALNQELTANSPILDARLPDCSRICATLSDVTPQGATMTLRIAPKTHITAEQLVGFGAMNQAMLDYLAEAIRLGKNIIVSGNTGSGKTTLLRALARFIPTTERIITCEDTQELYLDWLPHLVSMESPTRKGSTVEMKNLIETSLRMRPDRIWVGEIRKGSAADAFLQAINTGHSGCMTTIHANGCKDALARLQYLIASLGKISFELAHKQIMGNVDVFVHASRHSDYGRKITEIYETKNDELVSVFKFNQQKRTHESGLTQTH